MRDCRCSSGLEASGCFRVGQGGLRPAGGSLVVVESERPRRSHASCRSGRWRRRWTARRGAVSLWVRGRCADARADAVALSRTLRGGSQVLGSFTADVPASAQLDRDVDVVWVTAKSTSLEAALDLAPPDRVDEATIVPLLNGVDHLAVLRARYPKVVAATLRAETERVDDGQIVQRSPFVRIDIVGEPDIAHDVAATGIDCRSVDDEMTLLWQKLAFLAPL